MSDHDDPTWDTDEDKVDEWWTIDYSLVPWDRDTIAIRIMPWGVEWLDDDGNWQPANLRTLWKRDWTEENGRYAHDLGKQPLDSPVPLSGTQEGDS